MQTENNLLLNVPVTLGDLSIEGQVLLPIVELRNFNAPSKRNPNFRINLDLLISTDGAPSKTDVSWLMPSSGRLKDLHVLLVFEDGTIKGIEAQ